MKADMKATTKIICLPYSTTEKERQREGKREMSQNNVIEDNFSHVWMIIEIIYLTPLFVPFKILQYESAKILETYDVTYSIEWLILQVE